MSSKSYHLALLSFAVTLQISGGSVISAYDWNDGTTQGWYSSTLASNVENRLRVTNSGNGSLQFGGPSSVYSVEESFTISFELEIDSYSTVMTPADLTFARLGFNGPGMMSGQLYFPLNLTGLSFDETRVFTLLVSDGIYSDYGVGISRENFISNLGAPSFLFADPSFSPNTSSAFIDNYSIIPEPSVSLFSLVGGLALIGFRHRRS